MIQNYEIMYHPIVGAGETYQGHQPIKTPREMLGRVTMLKVAYEELRADIQRELDGVDARIIQPVLDAKQSLQPIRGVIKQREDKRVS